MFALLSIEENNTRRNSDTYLNTGNLLADLAGIAVTGIIDANINASKENKIIREGLKNNFRNCFIDLYCGDIIY